jgi:predicted ArsR family transcriptional regulator
MDKSAIIAEIQAYRTANHSEILPGDITKQDLVESLEVCEETARKVMKRLIADGKFTRHTVRGPNNQFMTVYRKVGE